MTLSYIRNTKASESAEAAAAFTTEHSVPPDASAALFSEERSFFGKNGLISSFRPRNIRLSLDVFRLFLYNMSKYAARKKHNAEESDKG